MFQLELDILDTKNFEIGSLVKKLHLFEVGRILKIREIPTSPFLSATMILMICYNLENEHSGGLEKVSNIFFGKYILQKGLKCNLSFIDEQSIRIHIYFRSSFFFDKKN